MSVRVAAVDSFVQQLVGYVVGEVEDPTICCSPLRWGDSSTTRTGGDACSRQRQEPLNGLR